MAGRPIKMAEKVAGFEVQAMELSAEVFLAVPESYRQRPDLRDRVGQAWHACMVATMQASIACERLGDMLRSKAGILEPGPSRTFLDEGCQKRANDGAEAEDREADG